MRAVDASVLAFAINRYAPEHARASAILEGLVNGAAPWALPWPAVHDFLGLVTHPHSVARPLSPADAWAFVAELAAAPTARLLGPTERHATALAEAFAAAPAGAGLPAGLELAAVLREHGVREVLTTDRSLREFAFLDVRDPFADAGWTPEAPPRRRYRRLKV